MARKGRAPRREKKTKKKKTEEDINETDDNSNLENYKEEPDSEEDEVQFKEEVEDMDVKEEVEEKDENFEDKVESYNDQECGWHEEENSDELEDGNINPAETDDFSASTPRPQSENPPEMDFKVKDENNVIKLNQSSLCTECGKSFASVTSLVDHVKATHAAKNQKIWKGASNLTLRKPRSGLLWTKVHHYNVNIVPRKESQQKSTRVTLFYKHTSLIGTTLGHTFVTPVVTALS